MSIKNLHFKLDFGLVEAYSVVAIIAIISALKLASVINM